MPRLSDDDNELAPRGRADIRQSIRNHDTALSAAAAVRSSPQKQKLLGFPITPPCATSKNSIQEIQDNEGHANQLVSPSSALKGGQFKATWATDGDTSWY